MIYIGYFLFLLRPSNFNRVILTSNNNNRILTAYNLLESSYK